MMNKYGFGKVVTLPKLYEKYPRKELEKLNKSKPNRYSARLMNGGFRITKNPKRR